MNLEQLNQLTLLYIEDDDKIRKKYYQSLKLLFKTIYQAINYQEAINLYEEKSPDILLVDINLGELSGIDIVKKIRETNINIPIVFLTAHFDNKYLLEVANLQIDGYIVKPLDIEKLQNAMINCLKKIKSISCISLDANLTYDLHSNELFFNKEKISLGKKENLLLNLLLKNKDRTISRDELEYAVWNETVVSDSSIKNLIGILRKKIGKEKIVNILGVGWKINI